MEYQKMINVLHNEATKLCKFRARNWTELNNESHGTGKADSQIKFKATMLKSSLCDYSICTYL